MKTLVIKRLIAMSIDLGIIGIYATTLMLCANLLVSVFDWKFTDNPYIAQMIGFFTLTLPVIIYSYLTEKSNWKGTVGKKLQMLVLLSAQTTSSTNILLRNILKYLPWELAHTGVHWINYYTLHGTAPPLWVWILVIFPQIIVIVYFISIVRSKGRSSIYDDICHTNINYSQPIE